MASSIVIRRNQRNIRCFGRTLVTYTHHHLSSLLNPSSSVFPSNEMLTRVSDGLIPQSKPVVPLIGQRYGALSLYNRYLCTKPETPKLKNLIDEAGKSKENGGETDDSSSQQQQQQTDQNAGKSVRGAPVSWLSFFLLLVTGGGVLYYFEQEKKRHIEGIHKASTAVQQGPSAGKANIGGEFKLVNQDGKYVTDTDFKGKWNLIYFGFTHCPDICPDELIKLAAAIDKIKEKSGYEIVPIFISVDPERDTVEQVGEYVKEFHPKIIGLTGTVDEVKKAARAYRVYYMKTEEEGSDYLVDHSIIMYLMNPEMEFTKYFGKNENVDSLTDGIIHEVKMYSQSKSLFARLFNL
ncbi:hypothetical protein MKW98_005165 [Papaver atlanticum]|uniref:Thioredoxin domain-containing protein n=1 Tax=Papaver atlanticum TaxID=357466 RepID=A0AAD4RW53_9MAGN|nr:hypothetical protein MKW98_005165 [Papaver atlanticum]